MKLSARALITFVFLAASILTQHAPLLALDTAEMYSSPTGKPRGKFIAAQAHIDRSYHGYYQEERQTLIDGIVESALRNGSSAAPPKIIFIAGGSGVGKSNIREKFFKWFGIDSTNFMEVDPDSYKKALPEFEGLKSSDPELASSIVHRESGYVSELIFEAGLLAKKNMILDTTFTDTEYFRTLIARLRRDHPGIRLALVDVEAKLSTSLKRVHERAKTQKRGVSEATLVAKHRQSKLTVRELNGLFDEFLVIRNETDPTISYRNNFLNRKAPIDIVFDIDWTLTYTGKFDPADPNVIEWDGKYYRLADGAIQILDYLSRLPYVRVSFFSGEHVMRNEELLSRIRLPYGKTAYDIAYQILSNSDLTKIEDAPPGSPFSERYKKNLASLGPQIDLERAIIVEDIKNFVPPEQLRNVLWLGKTFNFSETFPELSPNERTEHDPVSPEEWRFERKKLYRALAIVVGAIERSEREGISIVEAKQRIEAENPSFQDAALYEQGMKIIKEATTRPPKKTPLIKSSSHFCEALFAA